MKKSCLFIITLLFVSCAHRVSQPPVSKILIQKKDNVFSLWWKGKADIRTSSKKEVSVSIVVIAQKKPLCIRIELTNWLSGPLAYGFVKGKRFFFLSLKERKVYSGKLPSDIEEKYIWSVVRAIPTGISISRLTFQNGETTFVSKKFRISYKDYSLKENILFARNISVYLPDVLNLKVEIKKIKFNTDIPPQLFIPVIPTGFKVIKYQVPNL